MTAFAIGADGKLTPLNQQPSRGSAPCHLVVDRAGKTLLLANYGGGSVAAFPIGPDGRLGESTAFVQHSGSSTNPQRQKEPHAHSINLDAANRFAVAADLGLDKVLVYRFDAAKGTLSPNEPPSTSVKAGSGPRHFAFHPNGRNAYVINEIASTVTAFQYDAAQGVLKEVQTLSTLPKGYTGDTSTAEVQVHPSGKFLYGSNRGHDSIAVFAIEANGTLRYIENTPTGGSTPRNFGISPDGKYLLAANQKSDNVVVFRIDPKSGRLTSTGNTLEVPSPVCVKFLTSRQVKRKVAENRTLALIMKALVKKRAEPGLWLDDVPVPSVGINDVLIQVHKSSICGTDVHIYNWDAWAQKTIPVPMVIGHEYVGRVAEVGSQRDGLQTR